MKLPKCCTTSVLITTALAGFTAYSWFGFADALTVKNNELAALEASRKTQAQKLAQLEVERDELLEIMVAQDGLIQAQTQTLQKAKLYGEADKAAIQAQAQKLAQMRERISTEQKNRRSEKVGRSTADNVKRINRLWQR